jgi:hypothetical protein
MKLTQAQVSRLTLPDGKDDVIVWDDDMPGFGIRLRQNSQAFIIQGRIDGRQWRAKIGDTRRLKLAAARDIAKRKFAEITFNGHPQASRAAGLPSGCTSPGISKHCMAFPSTASSGVTLPCLWAALLSGMGGWQQPGPARLSVLSFRGRCGRALRKKTPSSAQTTLRRAGPPALGC